MAAFRKKEEDFTKLGPGLCLVEIPMTLTN